MKLSIKPQLLKLSVLCAGLLGLMLRIVLYATGPDEKGLLTAGHWAGVSVWVLTGGIILGLFLLTWSIRGPETYPGAHPRSIPAGAGCLILALAVLLSTLAEISAPSGSTGMLLTCVLGFLAVISLSILGVCRIIGAKPIFLFHGVLCLYFAVRMVALYQTRSADPQLQDYVFCLSSFVVLMLTAYQQAAFDADMGNHRDLWLTSLISVFLCMVALKGSGNIPMLAAAAIWAFTNLTNLKRRLRRQNPAPDQKEA